MATSEEIDQMDAKTLWTTWFSVLQTMHLYIDNVFPTGDRVRVSKHHPPMKFEVKWSTFNESFLKRDSKLLVVSDDVYYLITYAISGQTIEVTRAGSYHQCEVPVNDVRLGTGTGLLYPFVVFPTNRSAIASLIGGYSSNVSQSYREVAKMFILGCNHFCVGCDRALSSDEPNTPHGYYLCPKCRFDYLIKSNTNNHFMHCKPCRDFIFADFAKERPAKRIKFSEDDPPEQPPGPKPFGGRPVTTRTCDVECGLCSNTMTDPYSATCGHSYCRSCWEGVAASKTSDAQPDATTFPCPSCRISVSVFSMRPIFLD